MSSSGAWQGERTAPRGRSVPGAASSSDLAHQELGQGLFSPRYTSGEETPDLRQAFSRLGYVALPGLIDPSLPMFAHRVAALKKQAQRHEFVMPGIETPRDLSTVGGSRIAALDPAFASLHRHAEVVRLVESIVGAAVYECQHRDEFMVVNYLTQRGDSHGWHLDDPAYALILVVDAPDESQGGLLELVPHWQAECEAWGTRPDHNVQPWIERARSEGKILARHHAPGDGYLLKAARNMHRVTPITAGGARRAALNLAFQDVAHQVYGQSATILYGAGEARPGV